MNAHVKYESPISHGYSVMIKFNMFLSMNDNDNNNQQRHHGSFTIFITAHIYVAKRAIPCELTPFVFIVFNNKVLIRNSKNSKRRVQF